MTDTNTTTNSNNTSGDQWEREYKRDSKNKRWRGPTIEMLRGVDGVFWGIRNPLRAFLRGFGIFCGLCGVATIGSCGIQMLFRPVGTAELQGPGDILGIGQKAGETLREGVNDARTRFDVEVDITDTTVEDEEETEPATPTTVEPRRE